VMGLVLREGAGVAAVGVLLGLVAAVAISRGVSSMLLGVAALDVQVYGAVTAIVAGTFLAAIYLPARRITKIRVAEVLRGE
jgi:putative ABC transport system permease protein